MRFGSGSRVRLAKDQVYYDMPWVCMVEMPKIDLTPAWLPTLQLQIWRIAVTSASPLTCALSVTQDVPCPQFSLQGTHSSQYPHAWFSSSRTCVGEQSIVMCFELA